MNLRGWKWIGTIALVVLAAPSVAYCQGVSSSTANPISPWWMPLFAALIGAASALIAPLIKDLWIQARNERRAKSVEQREIFRNYAAPLVASCESVIWRFNEIIIDSRHQFLKSATLPKIYNEYKRKSTLYRLASLLGWVRAMNLELSALPRGASGHFDPIGNAIGQVRSALADGPHVEMHRLEQLCQVWNIDLSSSNIERKRKIATRIEVKLYELAGDDLREYSDGLRSLSSDNKNRICKDLSVFLCSELSVSRIDDAILLESVNRAISAMSYREALIYRDWQDAIGDVVLEKDEDSVRRYKVVGYEKFEGILSTKMPWIDALLEVVNDVDFENINPNDFRVKQLNELACAVSSLLISLSKTEDGDLINSECLAAAIKIMSVKR